MTLILLILEDECKQNMADFHCNNETHLSYVGCGCHRNSLSCLIIDFDNCKITFGIKISQIHVFFIVIHIKQALKHIL